MGRRFIAVEYFYDYARSEEWSAAVAVPSSTAVAAVAGSSSTGKLWESQRDGSDVTLVSSQYAHLSSRIISNFAMKIT